jgi:hypothetical protein
VDRATIPFGVVAVLVGLGSGFAMIAYPEGLNPAWPIGLALLAPVVFILGGLHIIASGLGYSRYSGILLALVALCLLAIVNWAAFFTETVQCRQSLSFLGVSILDRYPSEADCSDSLRIIIGSIDAFILIILAAFAWRRLGRTHDPG